MSRFADYEQKTTDYISPILDELGLELYDVEFVKEGGEYFLRAYIDKADGVTIEDCVAVSRRMNEILDSEDYIEEAYTFEVSSPGLDRPLKRDKDFTHSIGKRVELKTFAPHDGQREFTGILADHTKETVTITFEDGDYDFMKKDISMIRLAIDF